MRLFKLIWRFEMSVYYINQTLSQIVHILHFCLVDSLLHCAPEFVVNLIKEGTVGPPQIWRDECRSLALNDVDRLARPVTLELEALSC